MKRILFLLLIVLCFFLFPSCDKKDEPKIRKFETTENGEILKFIYDGMTTYYLWADDISDKKPVANQTPEIYFKSILSELDRKHSWSFITDDVDKLLGAFSGDPLSFGFNPTYVYRNQEKTTFFVILKYVFPNTPASEAGLKRLDIIGEIDGEPITKNNYKKLFGRKNVRFSIYKYTDGKPIYDREISITPRKIQTNPVLLDTIYVDEKTGKKIGYLFYTDFIEDYNKSLYNAFEKFKVQNVTDLIVDLRYNHGGRASAAVYLASMIVPENLVRKKAPFIKFSYNQFINDFFDRNSKMSRTNYLGEYDERFPNPLGANLNLNKVYIIATDDSYSASELTVFCLRDYMEVIHIGGNTGGKFTASWTIHPYDANLGIPIYDKNKLGDRQKENLKKWAMQPIVAFYTNSKEENFSNPGYLEPQFFLKEGSGLLINWTPIGDIKDTYLSKALYEITGNAAYRPTPLTLSKKRIKGLETEEVYLENPMDIKNSGVVINFPKSEKTRVLHKSNKHSD